MCLSSIKFKIFSPLFALGKYWNYTSKCPWFLPSTYFQIYHLSSHSLLYNLGHWRCIVNDSIGSRFLCHHCGVHRNYSLFKFLHIREHTYTNRNGSVGITAWGQLLEVKIQLKSPAWWMIKLGVISMEEIWRYLASNRNANWIPMRKIPRLGYLPAWLL
jgi:hypothetical protein